ncbi:MAG: phosphoribosyltransferase family protein, partial [bacterium]|nr:phosphoribosyltransferase family protein [bacterium]
KITLSSGKESDFYLDSRNVTLYPEGSYLVGEILFAMIKEPSSPEILGVGGMTLGADPIVQSVVLTSFLKGYPLFGFIIRKEKKSHGRSLWIEGEENLPSRAKVAILEDVVTTGATTIKAIERANDAGLEVVKVFCLVDREEGGKEEINRIGYELDSVIRRSQLLNDLDERT